MIRSADTDFWLAEQTEWLYDEIVYRSHMRTRNRVALACLLPAGIGAVTGMGPIGLVAVMAYVWVVWTLIYEREVARFLPARIACSLMVATYLEHPPAPPPG